MIAWALVGVLRGYQATLSRWLPSSCRFSPSCSEYAIGALREHGALRGTFLAARRLGRCTPWGGRGYDPVPSRRRRS